MMYRCLISSHKLVATSIQQVIDLNVSEPVVAGFHRSQRPIMIEGSKCIRFFSVRGK